MKPESPIKNTAVMGLWHGNSSGIRTNKKEGELSYEFVANTMIQNHERFWVTSLSM